MHVLAHLLLANVEADLNASGMITTDARLLQNLLQP